MRYTSTLLSGANSPLPPPINSRQNCMSAAMKRYKYLRRLFKFEQMDFECALWQMWYLFSSPQRVFRNFQYRKQAKSQFARDDPAFVVLLCGWLAASSIAFAIVLQLGFWQFVKLFLYVIFVDCVGVGILVATIFWYLGNKYLRYDKTDTQDIEWGYAFDIHLNAFFPPLVILNFYQLFFYNGLINHEWFISRVIGNTFWLFAVCYYIYITVLGYTSLPMIRRNSTMLTPLPILLLIYFITIIAGWNITHSVMTFYYERVK